MSQLKINEEAFLFCPIGQCECSGNCSNCSGHNKIEQKVRVRYEYTLLLDFIRHMYRNNPHRKDESNEKEVIEYMEFIGRDGLDNMKN